jgi:hypothetical protein
MTMVEALEVEAAKARQADTGRYWMDVAAVLESRCKDLNNFLANSSLCTECHKKRTVFLKGLPEGKSRACVVGDLEARLEAIRMTLLGVPCIEYEESLEVMISTVISQLALTDEELKKLYAAATEGWEGFTLVNDDSLTRSQTYRDERDAARDVIRKALSSCIFGSPEYVALSTYVESLANETKQKEEPREENSDPA